MISDVRCGSIKNRKRQRHYSVNDLAEPASAQSEGSAFEYLNAKMKKKTSESIFKFKQTNSLIK